MCAWVVGGASKGNELGGKEEKSEDMKGPDVGWMVNFDIVIHLQDGGSVVGMKTESDFKEAEGWP